MKNIQIDLSNLPEIKTDPSQIKKQVTRFLSDMDKDVSSFFHLPSKAVNEFAAHKTEFSKLKKGIKNFLHLGIGGSSLGAESIIKALYGPIEKNCRFFFLDNVDPDYLSDILSDCKPEQTLVYAVSKSGSTMETLSQLSIIYAWMEKELGKEKARSHFVFCTDPQKGDLRALAKEWKSPCFDILPNLGGRFSVLSAVGLFPAYWVGLNTDSMLDGARVSKDLFLKDWSNGKTPTIIALAASLIENYTKQNRNITVLMPYSQKLKTVTAWFTQLWAESLGKEGKGITPVGATGVTDQHSILQLLRDGPQDKVTGFIELERFENKLPIQWNGSGSAFQKTNNITMEQLLKAEFEATCEVMKNNQKPFFKITVPELNEFYLGQLLYSLQLLTGIAGYLLNINPFDQPGVEEGKILTFKKLDYLRSKAKI